LRSAANTGARSGLAALPDVAGVVFFASFFFAAVAAVMTAAV